MKKILIVLASVIVLITVGLLSFKSYNMNLPKQRIKKIQKLGVVEKQVTLPDGSIINYGENASDKKALLLIHGQETTWEDYANVLPYLVKRYRVFAIDCYGHGGSSKNPEKYPILKNGADIIWFIDNVVGENVIISGHSSGGLLATWVAANAPDKIDGLLIEDAPFFTTEKGRAEKTFAYKGFQLMRDFFESGEDSYTKYYIKNNFIQKYFNQGGTDVWKFLVVDPAMKYLEKNPGTIPRIWYYPEFTQLNNLYTLAANMQDGNGEYDLRFGLMFYDFSWFEGFNQAETLQAVKCPSVFLHVAKPKGSKSYYDEDGILMAALDDKDAKRVHKLLPNNALIGNIEGSMHDIHHDRPDEFIRGLKALEDMMR
ncbi:MAG TPA: alpha/beta hydrolase [Spirochaetota bacterium]|jgi:pimeloyl-ACP methyl ester carboxylesterase|nr:alpha/beta hydrolase [Spirochaetota bacterium]HQB60364.1 alpha/beta hydrolase [Spirochaetota bacterium]